MKATELVLRALRDAPMDDEALMHELDLSRRSVGQALGVLCRRGAVHEGDKGRWHLVQSTASPLAICETPTPHDSKVDAIARTAVPSCVATNAAFPVDSREIHYSRVVAVLLAAGLVTADAIADAERLVRRD